MRLYLSYTLLLTLLPLTLASDCECSSNYDGNKEDALPLKIAAILSILVCGTIGVSLPFAGRWVPALNPEKDVFFVIKAFAAGVILSTAFVHIMPESYESLTSSCLPVSPWGKFPFAGFISMLASIGTLMLESIATGYYVRASKGGRPVVHDEEKSREVTQQPNGHTHAHSHGFGARDGDSSTLLRQRVLSQVLELGIVVHSVIIGISLGASQSRITIRPLVAAISFHQFFEGMGLGGTIVQAKFKTCKMVTMIIFFSLTTPTGITIGIGISSIFSETSPNTLIVEGVLNSASAGILIYMALVDLLAADFMNPRVQSNGMLQLGTNVSLLVGAGSMSILAKWV